jgi:hypothetical protein
VTLRRTARAGMTPTMATPPHKELRLPKPAKIALLILTAMVFVGALYLALPLEAPMN